MGYDFPGNKMEYWVMKNMFNLGDQDEGGAGMSTSDRGTNIRKVPMKQDGKIRSSWLFILLGHLIKDWHIPEVGPNQHAGTTQQRANPVLSFKYSSLWKTNFVYHCTTHSIKDILVLIRWTLFAHLSVEYWKNFFSAIYQPTSVQLAGASEWQMESEYVLFLTHGHKMSFSKTNESPIIDM